MKNNYDRVLDYGQVEDFLSSQFDEVWGTEFYEDLFPSNELRGEYAPHYSRPNAIYLYKYSAEERKGKIAAYRRTHPKATLEDYNPVLGRRIMLKDEWSNDYMQYVERNGRALCSGLAYRGRVNQLQNAQCMNALIFDLDRVGLHEIRTLFHRITLADPRIIRTLPVPTYVVTSGTGLHLYYVFTQPIPLFPNIKAQLKSYKHALTFRMWDYKSTTLAKEIQYQSINQGFRMVGSTNEKYGYTLRAFRTGSRVTMAYLNAYVDPDDRVDLTKPYRPTQMSREEAKEKFPVWYQSRIVEGRMPGHWHCKTALYQWWKRQLDKVKGGHRYFFLLCLAVYAVKCDIDKDTLRRDMDEAFKTLKTIDNAGDPFTRRDVESAMEMYDKEYYCFTINDIEKLSGIPIQRNRRNGRNQEKHLRMARLIRDEINGRKNTWRDGNGRKSKAQMVYEFRCQYPAAGVSAAAKRLGISRPTVTKWWFWAPEGKAPIPAPEDLNIEDFFRLAKHDS